jgi:hypothetical protein
VAFEMGEIKGTVEENNILGHSMGFGNAEVRIQFSKLPVCASHTYFEHFS